MNVLPRPDFTRVWPGCLPDVDAVPEYRRHASEPTTADYLRARRNPPAPKLKAGVVYSGDNGQRICVHCAGYSAKYTGRDRSGHRVTPNSQADADWWMQATGKSLACEAGCTKHPPTVGVMFDPKAAGVV